MPIFKDIHVVAMPQGEGIDGLWEQIEAAARTCYRSEGKTRYGEDGKSLTAESFGNKIINVYKHQSVAEHATVYLEVHMDQILDFEMEVVSRYEGNPFSRVIWRDSTVYITTNYRVLVENGWLDDIVYMVNTPSPHHIRRYTIRVFTDRGVSAESNRHRCMSPTERSTRFVNYGHDKELSIIVPPEIDRGQLEMTSQQLDLGMLCKEVADGGDLDILQTWLFANLACEWSYMRLLELGWKPQQARRVLPMGVETELVITAYEDQWIRYFQMRYHGSTGTPHPDMKITCGKIMEAFQEQGWPIE